MKYVSCEIMGGLGNQLFQIFAVIAFAMKHNLTFVFQYYEEIPGFKPPRFTAWNHFLKDLKKYTTADERNDMISSYIPNFPIYREPGFRYKEIPFINSYMFLKLYGYFQSYKYFDKYFDQISDLIQLDKQIKQVHDENIELLSDDYNISMHFRVGDYKQLQKYHPLMPFKYYYNSLKYVLKNAKDNRKILYFCEKEDTDFVNETIAKLKLHYTDLNFMKVDDNIPDWKQMLIMANCDANIIANSTFSWWGAYFNKNPKKIVCYPNVWFGQSIKDKPTTDLIPVTWKEIHTRNDMD